MISAGMVALRALASARVAGWNMGRGVGWVMVPRGVRFLFIVSEKDTMNKRVAVRGDGGLKLAGGEGCE